MSRKWSLVVLLMALSAAAAMNLMVSCGDRYGR
jgi:hypothetical protein